MGGYFVNYFNRFGRQWQVYVQAEGEYRTDAEERRPVLRAQRTTARWCRSSASRRIETRLGPEFTMRYNDYRSAQINGSAAPGYSSAQAMKALEEVFAQTMPSEMGLRLSRHVVPGEESAAKAFRRGDLRLLAAVRVPDSRRALRELVAAVQRAARHCRSRSSAPSLALWLRGMENNVYAQIGWSC